MSVARHSAARKTPSGAERIGAVRGSRSRTDIEGTLEASTRTTPPSYAGRRSIGRGPPRSGFECRVYGDPARRESFGRVMPAFDKDPCGLRFLRYRPGMPPGLSDHKRTFLLRRFHDPREPRFNCAPKHANTGAHMPRTG